MQDKKVMEFETFSPEETLELGRKFGREAQPGKNHNDKDNFIDFLVKKLF